MAFIINNATYCTAWVSNNCKDGVAFDSNVIRWFRDEGRGMLWNGEWWCWIGKFLWQPQARVAQAGWWFGVRVVPKSLLALNFWESACSDGWMLCISVLHFSSWRESLTRSAKIKFWHCWMTLFGFWRHKVVRILGKKPCGRRCDTIICLVTVTEENFWGERLENREPSEEG